MNDISSISPGMLLALIAIFLMHVFNGAMQFLNMFMSNSSHVHFFEIRQEYNICCLLTPVFPLSRKKQNFRHFFWTPADNNFENRHLQIDSISFTGENFTKQIFYIF